VTASNLCADHAYSANNVSSQLAFAQKRRGTALKPKIGIGIGISNSLWGGKRNHPRYEWLHLHCISVNETGDTASVTASLT